MNIFITGGSGFVGTALSGKLLEEGHTVVSSGMSSGHKLVGIKGFSHIEADTSKSGPWQEEIKNADAVINLAGTNIFNYWTDKYKKLIYDSRILTTKNVVEAITKESKTVLLSTSAAGYYGSRGDDMLKEDAPPGDDFLATVCVDWEKEALTAEAKGARVVIMRFGVVLGKNGGALSKMLLPFKMGVGGPLGNGKQWFPWIHMDDLVSAILYIFRNKEIKGPVNFCAPGLARQKAFARALGRALKRPAFIPAPAFVIKTAMGELGQALMSSQRAVPDKLMNSGFQFKHPEMDGALGEIV